MELEFDKEIDAILRGSRGARGAPVAGGHLDADAIGAFAENAVPAAMRKFYALHLADCDRCRKLLSQTILLNETGAQTAPVKVVGAAEAATDAVLPWYIRLFRTPNIAVAMGALIVLFGGVLTFLVIQNRDREVNVAQVENVANRVAPSAVSAPTASGGLSANANTAAPFANAATNSASVSNPAVTGTSSGVGADQPSLAAQPEAKPADTSTSVDKLDGLPVNGRNVASPMKPATEESTKTATVAAPPPAPTGGAVADDKKAEMRADALSKEKDRDEERSRRNEAALPAAKNAPGRAGPLQMQSNQINTQPGEMAVTRKAGGKTFENKNGAWYDHSYSGQATQNYRRGTPEYLKLDKGLRSLADNIGGTVVVVWKGTAYRIQ